MTTPNGPQRAYNLASMSRPRSRLHVCVLISNAVIKVGHIEKVLQTAALYVRPHLSGIKLHKTQIIQNPTQAWEYACTL